MKRKIFCVLTILALLFSVTGTCASALVHPHNWHPKPLTDPSKAGRVDIEAIHAENVRMNRTLDYPSRGAANYNSSISPSELLTNSPIPTTPYPHSVWGTEIYGPDYEVIGVFAQQFIDPDLTLANPNQPKNRTLFAPTLTAPSPNPLEVSTEYFSVSPNYETYRCIHVFDFYKEFVSEVGGWNTTEPIYYDSDSFVNHYGYNVGSNNPYYYVEIQYWSESGTWACYLYNRPNDNWDMWYNTTNEYEPGLFGPRTRNGWDFFEACTFDSYYDSSWTEISIFPKIQSCNLMIDHETEPYGYHWDYATSSCSGVFNDGWGTALASTHYFNSQYSDWVVRNPTLTVNAQDNIGEYVFTSANVDGESGYTGDTFSLIPGTHSITVGTYGVSAVTNYYGGYEYFSHWDSGSYNPTRQISISGSDQTITAYYQWYL